MKSSACSFCALLALSFAPLAAWGANAPDDSNPQPSPDDLVLPMPDGAHMVFRPVWLGVGANVLATRKFTMGDRGGEHAKEKAMPTELGGTFVADHNGKKDALYYIGKYEVTEAQFNAVMSKEETTPQISAQSRVPRVNISRAEVDDFINKYNDWLAKNALDKLPKRDSSPGYLRLPTEQEWE